MDNNDIPNVDNRNGYSKDKKQKNHMFLARIGAYCREYCDYTGIHGFKYFGEQRTLCEK